MRRYLLTGLLAAVAMVTGQAASLAVVIALDRVPTAGGQSGGYSLGTVFQVVSPIKVTAVGVFDSGSNGLTGTLHALIYQLTGFQTGTPVSGTSFDVTQANSTVSPGGAYRLLSITPVTLNPGPYMIAAYGFSGSDPNGNGNGSPTQDTGGGGISFTGSFSGFGFGTGGDYYVSGNGNFPVAPGSVGEWLAGTFQFDIPEPASLSLLALGALAMLRRRR